MTAKDRKHRKNYWVARDRKTGRYLWVKDAGFNSVSSGELVEDPRNAGSAEYLDTKKAIVKGCDVLDYERAAFERYGDAVNDYLGKKVYHTRTGKLKNPDI